MKKLNLFSLLAEQLLLGSLLINNSLWEKISNILYDDDFFFKNHKVIYSSIIDLITSNKSFDIIILADKIKNLTSLKLLNIINYLEILKKKTINNIDNIYNYALIIHDMAILRKLFIIANKIIDKIFLNKKKDVNILLKNIELDILNVSDYYNKIKSNISIIGPIFKKIFYEIKFLNKNNLDIDGISTGFIDLDNILSGLHKGEFIIIAGRPSMGKTALAINIAQNISLNSNLPVIIFSLEMSSKQLVTRILSNMSLINQHNIKSGVLSHKEFDKLENIINNLYFLKFFIDESSILTPLDIFFKCKKIISEYGNLGLIVIDYLQLMNSSNFNKNRVMEISEISRTLKRLAKELNVPIIAISQLNRCVEFRDNKRPILSDLRESGAIEQDADTILFIYRDEIYNPCSTNKGLVEILISKQRNGPTGIINLFFSSKNLKFNNYSDLEKIF